MSKLVNRIKNMISDLDNIDDLNIIKNLIGVQRKYLAQKNAFGLVKGDVSSFFPGNPPLSGGNFLEKDMFFGVLSGIKVTAPPDKEGEYLIDLGFENLMSIFYKSF